MSRQRLARRSDAMNGDGPATSLEHSTARTGHVDVLMDWCDPEGRGSGAEYLAWTWDDWPGYDSVRYVRERRGGRRGPPERGR
jgi:hypothetical protein